MLKISDLKCQKFPPQDSTGQGQPQACKPKGRDSVRSFLGRQELHRAVPAADDIPAACLEPTSSRQTRTAGQAGPGKAAEPEPLGVFSSWLSTVPSDPDWG